MELYHLRAFVITAETGQITRAADRLHITQPAVSAQIKSLEQEIGVALFDRVANGVRLTDAGRDLLDYARNVIVAATGVTAQARKLREDGCRELRLGTVLHPRYIKLGAIVSDLQKNFPLIHLRLRHGLSSNVLDGILDQELDAAFCVGDCKRDAIAYVPLAKLNYRIVGSASIYPQIKHMTLERLCELPWLVAPPTSTQAALLEQLFHGSPTKPPRVIEVDQETTRICLVLEGVGLALMRDELAYYYQRSGQLVIWQGRGPSTSLSLAYLEQRKADQILDALKDLVLTHWKSPVGDGANDIGMQELGALLAEDLMDAAEHSDMA